jgi:hypothetical protein
VQVGPMEPVLIAPGNLVLTLTYDEPLSNFAFKFNIRRCTELSRATGAVMASVYSAVMPLILARHPRFWPARVLSQDGVHPVDAVFKEAGDGAGRCRLTG